MQEIIDEIYGEKQKVHIRIRQRNNRQSVTTIEGLPSGLKMQKLLSNIKKSLHCNGSLHEDNIIMLSGDQRNLLQKFLIDENIVSAKDIVIHGF